MIRKLKDWWRGQPREQPLEEILGEIPEGPEYRENTTPYILKAVWNFWLSRWPIILPMVAAAGVALFIHFDSKENRQKSEGDTKIVTAEANNDDLVADAKAISESIVIWGGESPGVDLGYLAQLAGFYDKYKERYPSQHALYSKELTEWQQYFSRKRASDSTIYKSDVDALVGLVKSGEDHLESIVKSNSGTYNKQRQPDS